MLPNLVVELQLSIFSRLDTFRDALNLAATSRKLQQTWTQNKTYLADNILQQTVTSYPDAAAFAFAQLFAQKHAHTQVKYQCISLTTNTYPGIDKEGKRHDADKHPVLTPLQARILLNADIVSLSCSHFLTSTVGPDMTAGRLTQKAAGLAPRGLNAAGPATISPHRDPPFLTEREEERFHHAYYRVWAWLTYEYVRGSESEEKQKGIVEGCGLVEHWRMCEMAYFLVNDCSPDYKRSLCDGCHGQIYTCQCNRMLGNLFHGYITKLIRLGHSGVIPKPGGGPRDFYIAVFDCHQEALKNMVEAIQNGENVQ